MRNQMTLPDEMFNSLRAARSFMTDMLDPALYPKLPKQVRLAARARLKHFPTDYDINQLEQMYNNSNKDKGILIGETNAELQRIAGEAMLVNARLTKVSQSIQELINKP